MLREIESVERERVTESDSRFLDSLRRRSAARVRAKYDGLFLY